MEKEETKITSGSEVMDWLLEGGYEKEVITTIYGPAGSGKTTLSLICLVKNSDKKVIFIDTEGSFSIARIKQLTDNYEQVLKNVIVLKPTDFSGQKKVFDKIKSIISNKVGLIIIDSIAMLYRLEIGKNNKDFQKVNRELGAQLADLIQIARKFKIPIILTNQIYADLDDKSKVNIVGGEVLRYASKCLLEIQRTEKGRKVIIRRHRHLPEGKEIEFKIKDEGIEEI